MRAKLDRGFKDIPLVFSNFEAIRGHEKTVIPRRQNDYVDGRNPFAKDRSDSFHVLLHWRRNLDTLQYAGKLEIIDSPKVKIYVRSLFGLIECTRRLRAANQQATRGSLDTPTLERHGYLRKVNTHSFKRVWNLYSIPPESNSFSRMTPGHSGRFLGAPNIECLLVSLNVRSFR